MRGRDEGEGGGQGCDLALVVVGEGLDELDEAEAAIDDDVPLLAERGRLGRSRAWYVMGARSWVLGGTGWAVGGSGR